LSGQTGECCIKATLDLKWLNEKGTRCLSISNMILNGIRHGNKRSMPTTSAIGFAIAASRGTICRRTIMQVRPTTLALALANAALRTPANGTARKVFYHAMTDNPARPLETGYNRSITDNVRVTPATLAKIYG
jgi:hypothetical protein